MRSIFGRQDSAFSTPATAIFSLSSNDAIPSWLNEAKSGTKTLYAGFEASEHAMTSRRRFQPMAKYMVIRMLTWSRSKDPERCSSPFAPSGPKISARRASDLVDVELDMNT